MVMDGYDTSASVSSCESSDSSLVVWLHEELADGTTRTTTLARSMDTLKVLFVPPSLEGAELSDVLEDERERKFFWKGIKKVIKSLKKIKKVSSPHASVLASLRDEQLIGKQAMYFGGLDEAKQTELCNLVLSVSLLKAGGNHYAWFVEAIGVLAERVRAGQRQGRQPFTWNLLYFIVGTLDTRHKIAVLAEEKQLASSTNKLYFDYESHSFGKFSPAQMKNMLKKARAAATATKEKKGDGEDEKQEEGDGADTVEQSKSAEHIDDLRISNSIYDTPDTFNIVICSPLQIFDDNGSVRIENPPGIFDIVVAGIAKIFGGAN